MLILIHGQLVPLTELQQIPTNTVIDALHGTIKLTTALNGGIGRSRRGRQGQEEEGQDPDRHLRRRDLQDHPGPQRAWPRLRWSRSAFKGAPTYATCKAHKAADATAAALSSKTLQLLTPAPTASSAPAGRYSAATVRGTKWTIADRCDGTLTHDITDSVVVTDFVHHKTIILHAGQSYLARKP